MKRLLCLIVGLVVFCGAATAQLIDRKQVDKLNTVYKYIRDSYVDDVSLEPLVERAIIASFKELDPHSKYLTKEEMESAKSRLRGEYAGIGIKYTIHNDTVVVRGTLKNSPAQNGAIRPNDRIISINSHSLVGVSIDSVTTLLKGGVGSVATLEVKRQGVDLPLSVKLKREIVEQSAIESALRFGDVGYIAISSFPRRVDNDFYAAYMGLGDIKALVVDLRDNGGGYISSAINLTSLFLEKDDVIVETEGSNDNKVYRKRRDTKPIDIPLVVLINENSASASEIFAGAIQDHDRGIIVGHTSFGKGLVQRIFNLNDGSGIYLTVARYKTPSGRVIQRPYTMGEGGAYIADSLRYLHPDSISYKDRPIYKTLKLGREVYGGGGITPDRYIDVSGEKISDIVIESIEEGVVEHTIIDYCDEVAIDTIKQTYPQVEEFYQKYNMDARLREIFDSRVQYDIDNLTEFDRAYIETSILSALAERLYGQNGYYYIYVLGFDTMAKVAIEIANNEIVE